MSDCEHRFARACRVNGRFALVCPDCGEEVYCGGYREFGVSPRGFEVGEKRPNKAAMERNGWIPEWSMKKETSG